ncbi:MAG: outer membrane protein assembly factor BamA [Candidatus Omnitrophota bacterium]
MKKIIIFSLIGIFYLASNSIVIAQGQVGVQEKTQRVSAIDIIGNKTISTATILSKLKVKLGQTFSDQVIKDDIKKLYSLGFFSDIEVDTQDYEKGVKVIFTVKELPIVDNIIFQGRHAIGEYALKSAMKTKKDEFLEQTKLKDDIQGLVKLYQRKGFSHVSIDSKSDLDENTNKVKVTILIDEGTKLMVSKISINGNAAFGYKKVLSIMKTRRPFIWPLTIIRNGLYKEGTLKEDIDKIRAFYKRGGYQDVEVEYSTEKLKKNKVAVSINIKEGIKYVVGTVSIEGNSIVKEQEIRSNLSECLPGKVFSQDGLSQDVSNIQSLCFDKGYIFAEVKESTSLDAQTGRVNITYNIAENQIGYVDMIKIRGNIKTKDVVIRRELRIYPADRFSGEKLRRSRERLNNLGFFEEINYDTEPGSAPNKKNLIVQVKESKTGEFMFGGGYSSVDQFIGFAQIEQKNFDWRNFPYFTGGGQDLSLRAELGSLRKEFGLSFTEPWIFDYPLSFGFDLYNRSHYRDTDVGYAYDEKRTGGDLRLAKELSEYLKAHLFWRFDNIEITNIDEAASSDLKKEEGQNTIISTEFGLDRDTRDNIFEPTRGRLLSGAAELAGGPLGGDKNFTKFIGSFSNYIPITRKSVLQSEIRAGITQPFGSSDEVPIYERFYAGGSDTIRGYRERKVGPIDAATDDPIGGEALLIGNLEYVFPLVEYIKGATFFDVGNVWSKVKDFGSSGYKSSVGLGLRIKTPLGPLRLDYGYPLNKEPGETKRQGRLHFSISHGFF